MSRDTKLRSSFSLLITLYNSKIDENRTDFKVQSMGTGDRKNISAATIISFLKKVNLL